jgi:hypothetical protein
VLHFLILNGQVMSHATVWAVSGLQVIPNACELAAHEVELLWLRIPWLGLVLS